MTSLPGSASAPVCGSARPTPCLRSRMVVLALVAMTLALVPSVCVATRPYATSDGGDVELAATGRDLMQANGDSEGTTRTYYISAEEVMWDYTGGNGNTCVGRDFNDDENVWVGNGLGAVYKKARFIQYTDETFTEVIPSAPHEGILGPTIFMEVGDELVIEFRNTLPFFANIQVNGLRGEGPQLSMVPPGNSTTYRFMAGPDSAPGPADGVSTVWTYSSTMDLAGHANLGLLGAIIVTKKGEANPDGRAKDVDHDRVLAMQVLNENASPFLEDNLAGRTIEELGMTEEEFEESNLMHGMNGLVFCNLFGLEFNVGERVRWHTLSVGNEVDMHTNHWHGHTLLTGDGRHRMDTVQLLPATTSSMDMVVDRPGTWLIHCHVNDHLAAGMIALYTVIGEAEPFEMTGQERVYYFQAETVEWDYLPNGDQCPDLPEYSEGIGAPQTFTKARYFQYADPEFSIPVPRPEEDMHLGILGPTIRAEVGDRIIVHFRNKDVPFPISVHPHGVSYNKDSEGAPYNDGTSGADKRDDFVEAGQEWTYTWDAGEDSSPGSGDGSSVMWMYHSHTDEITNTYAGLEGAIIITAKGMADEEGRPTDVDRELVVLYQVFDEDWSPYAVVNTEQEMRHLSAINGYMFCNLEGLTMTEGETVRMYVFGLGTEIDVHSPHAMASVMRGNIGGIEAFGLLPGGMHSLDLHPSQTGRFRFDDRNDALVRMGARAEMVVLASADEEMEQEPEETSANGDNAPIRRYWIAADEVEWDYAPNGNACLGEPFTEETGGVFANPSKYTKALYREYTNGSFSEIIPGAPVAGMVGPLLTCEEGDTLHISFRNNLPFAANLHPGGFDAIGDAVDSVPPGRTAQLFFRCPNAVEAELAEMRGEDPVISFTYISTVDPVVHTNTGLLGPVLVAKKGTLESVMQKPTVPMLFSVQDENESFYFVKNLLPIVMPEEASEVADDGEISEAARAALDNLDPEGNLMHGINGYIFCNGPPLTCNPDDEMRLILMGFGSETGIHGPRISDHALRYHGRRATAPAIYPSTSVVADLTCYVEGFYAVWCDVHDHVDAGMSSLFVIGNPGTFTGEATTA